MDLLVDVLKAFNKSSRFISLWQYMCGFFLRSHMRHANINQTQWLKSETHLKGTTTSQAMESYIITMLHTWKTLIPGLRMFGGLHAEYVHYHPIDDLCLNNNLRMEGSWFCELVVQSCLEDWPECAQEPVILIWYNGLRNPKMYWY